MTQRVFVTGTDTEIGKSQVAELILSTLPYTAVNHGWKPIAAGCEQNGQGQWVNEDALLLQSASTSQWGYASVNPIALPQPIAPHIAAQYAQLPLSVQLVQEHFEALPKQMDHLVIEGAGGWLLPLNAKETLADWVCLNQLPVVLVVGMRLGCLNHALLTWQDIQARGLRCLGWVANSPEPTPMAEYAANLAYLQHALPVPMLAEVPFMATEQERQQWLQQHAQFGAQLLQN
ncbi:dethiobiotin synthase [Aliidiomarina taiwanensis]|uniref:ATP-dependent dethiobiotin synthetase BioD n=1 Tax=Aliidiomarina taiwanensis TaxID=946228 RepID=A0A432X9W3_9GAMM|nr:dethiobiotin synthase [Aliidiomarina taiwanensis]RUO44188.1 dethiobiotin synthase [Aliidiomarina taiwanensis]